VSVLLSSSVIVWYNRNILGPVTKKLCSPLLKLSMNTVINFNWTFYSISIWSSTQWGHNKYLYNHKIGTAVFWINGTFYQNHALTNQLWQLSKNKSESSTSLVRCLGLAKVTVFESVVALLFFCCLHLLQNHISRLNNWLSIFSLKCSNWTRFLDLREG
jgi:hypothetical protein